MLPSKVDEFPALFGDDLLPLLKGSQLLNELLLKKKLMQADWDMVKTIGAMSKFTYDEFAQAFCICESRS